MKLVLAEKPSVAQSLAKVLGANKRCDGYLEGNGYVVSWCVGHLVELSQPEAYNETYAKWRLEDLPILPTAWKYQVSASTKKQFGILKDLMKREDVKSLVCATDAGREGELIFRLVYHQADCRKPFERLWISSMEDQAIRDGFAHLEPSTKYDALYEAALCRERADWIVGMNATRLFSCLYHQTLNVGRVMTPTLAMVVMRDAEIAAFVSKPFYTVQLGMDGITAASRRFDDKEDAQEVLAKCKESMKAVVKSMDRKEKTEHAPLLYDLTSLQRDANRILREVLGCCGLSFLDLRLRKRHHGIGIKNRAAIRLLLLLLGGVEVLPDIFPTAIEHGPDLFRKIFATADQNDHVLRIAMIRSSCAKKPHRDQLQDRLFSGREGRQIRRTHGSGRNNGMVVADLSTVTHSIHGKFCAVVGLPGGSIGSNLFGHLSDQGGEHRLHVLCQVSAVGTRIGHKLLFIERLGVIQRLLCGESEDTLLSSMETAGAEDIPEDAERKGLGTPATRAGIIEKLVQKGFMERKGDKKTRYLISTDKGNALITVMPEQIQSASMTADWEQKLLRMERGDYEAEDFMKEITEMISRLVQNYDAVKGADKANLFGEQRKGSPGRTLMTDHKRVGACPCCQADVLEKQKGWFCSNQECRFVLWKDNAFFKSLGKRLSPGMVEKLLTDGRIRLKDCKSQRSGRSYNATLLLTTEENGRANFNLEFENSRGSTKGERSR